MQRNDDVSPTANQPDWVLGAELAKELDVQPPVLGNWRIRYSDFPPIKKSETGRFLYNRAEVIRWFKSHQPESPTRPTQIWNFANSVRGSLDEGEFLLTSLAMLSMIKLGKRPPSDNYIDRHFVESRGEIGKTLLSVFDLWEYRDVDLDPMWKQLGRIQEEEIPLWLQAIDNLPKGRFSQITTADSINELIVNLVEHRKTTVFDPAVGQGRTLLRVAKEIHGNAEGQELNSLAREICVLRAFLLDVPAKIKLADSLTDDGFPSERYEVIVADPPMGLRMSESARSRIWPLGQPGILGDWAWAQLIVLHLANDGEGYLILSSGALFNKQSTEIRREMIRRGCIEAVISLPPLATSARVPLVLLFLRAPDIKTGVGVLMIDASEISGRRGEEFVSNIPKIVNRVKAFRANPDAFSADERSVVVPVLDLLEGECSLVPTHLIMRARKSETIYRGELRPLLESLRSIASSVALLPGETSIGKFELTHMPLKTLRAKGMAHVISGVRIGEEILQNEDRERSTVTGKQKVLTVRTLRIPGPLFSTEYIDKNQMQTTAVTQPGDIVITRIGESQAKVDAEGGNLVLAPLSILRLDTQFDPYVAAAAINSDHVRKLTAAGGFGRIDLDILEIPQISIKQAEGLRKTLLQIEQLEADVEALRQQLVKWHKVGGDYIATASEVTL